MTTGAFDAIYGQMCARCDLTHMPQLFCTGDGPHSINFHPRLASGIESGRVPLLCSTDEDAFRLLSKRQQGFGILVSSRVRA